MDGDDDDFEDELVPTAFAVRLAEDQQVVGIFVAVDLDQLADLVDQCCDPAATEYLRMGVGGVYVGTPTAARWPARELRDPSGEVIDIEPDDEDALRGASLDDFWWRDIYQGEWFPLVWERSLPKRPTRRRLKVIR